MRYQEKKSEATVRRVLFIATQLEARGTNAYILYLAGELKSRGLDVAVFCAPGPMLEALRERGIDTTTFKHLAGFRFPSGRRAEFLEHVRGFAPDIVHAPSLEAVQRFVSVVGELRVPIVATLHCAPSRSRTFRSVASRLAGIIATSQKVREQMVNDFRFPKNKIVMIGNGVDADAIGRHISRPVFSNPVPVMGSVGPVEWARGHELFIRAASLLLQSGHTAQFVIAGEGGEISRLSRLGSREGLDKYLTFVRDFASYHDILDALDVVVQNALVDVSGFSLLDAMAAGRPVVAFNTGTVCEMITDGVTGLIVQEDTPDALAASLVRLVGDAALGRRLGQAARNSVREQFNIVATADAVVDFYSRWVVEHE